ncbi:SusC/RagA family TonB-linked outer membrane protein [Pedobacter frigoris]|uniref:SusC/RagA family TonB-linked outer membrane protein n=1 Tax=Pedobacter frigoris TaxID=2571272 RepID=UPI00292F7D49|nr:SusC/RagA family TonB-linked outer membrane protein [Pedobacter frigoris]
MNFYMTFKRCLTGNAYAKILLKLKLTFIILTTVILQVSATGFAQITLKEKAAPLEQIIQKIRKQTGYDFFYNAGMLAKANPVTLNVNDASVKEVLDLCFKNQPLTYRIEQKTIVVQYLPERILVPYAAIVITGKILDENGKPIPGASIRIKGANGRAIASAADGSFRIVVNSEDDVLLVNYVGYEPQEIKLKGNQGQLTIKMSIAESQLKGVEIINTGLFKKSDKSFTGASTTVTAKDLQDFGNRNLITSLRNIDPSFNIIESNAFGSDPNRLPEIQIRGNSSLPNVGELQDQTRVGLNTPLIILDGFQSTLQKMLDINENEVESITMLKDAAATAMYGSRGSNGVIIIVTKSPKMGKLRLSYGANFNFEAPDLTDYSLLKAREKLDLELKAGYYNNARAETDLPLKRYYNFILNEVNSGVETDWMALPLRSSLGQRHNLRLEGGDQAFRYSASAQINNIAGVMKGSGRNTFNGNITLAYTYKTIRFRNNLQVQQTKKTQSPYGLFSEYVQMNPYWRAFDDKGNPVKVVGNPGNFDYSNFWNVLPTNPLYNATLNTFEKSQNAELINNTSVEWNLTDDLVLRGQFGITKGTVQDDKFRPADHTAFANYIDQDVFRKGDYAYGITNALQYDGSMNLSYSKTFAGKHILFAGMDYNVRQDKSSTNNFLAEGFPNASFDFPSMALQYAKDGKPFGRESLVRSVGFTGNVNYSYANRYFIDGSLRLDGSSQFGSNKRFAPFWSTGIGWNLHNEEFLRDNKYVNRLKLRGSMGITGSQNFNAYQALSTYQYYLNDRYFNWMGADLMGLGNENLKWQQAMKYNVGMDAEFLNRHLKITADVYQETTNDLISSINLPSSNGFPFYIENIGKLRNKGYELKATGFLMMDPKGFTWSVSGALMHNKNKVVETSQALKDAQAGTLNGTADPGRLYIEGYSSNDIWVVPSLGIDPSTGKELYLGKDGLPTYTWKASDIVSVGSTDPTIFGNFSTMVKYKEFSVNASFRYTVGAQQYNSTLVSRVETNSYKYNVDSRVYDSRWQQPGDIAAFKGLLVTTPTFKTSRFVQDENTLVCNNINFQYDLRSQKILQKLKLEALNFTANVAEPMYLSTIRRERGTTYPFSRQFSFSINATF